MIPTVYPCVWHNHTALAAAAQYCLVFPQAAVVYQSNTPSPDVPPTLIELEIGNQRLMLLNGGSHFAPNPSISMMVRCATRAGVDQLWEGLHDPERSPLMALGSYAWSDRYGWCTDRWGFTWELMYDPALEAGTSPQLQPSILFANARFGEADAAMVHYQSLFDGSSERNRQDIADGPLQGKRLMTELVLPVGGLWLLNDSSVHDFDLNEGVSLVLWCDDQAELDGLWEGLLTGGGKAMRAGWLRDAHGVVWQVLPREMPELFAHPEHGPAAMRAMMSMQKIELATLRNARA